MTGDKRSLVLKPGKGSLQKMGFGFAAIGLAAGLAGCGGSPQQTSSSAGSKSSAASTSNITLSQVGPDAGKWPIYAAMAEGFFRKEGVSVSMSTSGGSPNGVQAVLAHATDIAEVGDTDAISAAAGGGSIVMVAGEEDSSPYVVNVAKGISSISQLSGKKVSTSAPTNITQLYWDAVVQKNGLDPKAFTYVYAATTGDRFAALKGGVVQAAILLPPYSFEAQAAGMPVLVNTAKYSSYPFTSFAVSPNWAASHRSELIAFLKGYLLGVKWLYNPANRTAAINILLKDTKSTKTAAADSYDFFVKQLKIFPVTGAVRSSAIPSLITALTGVGAFKSKPSASKLVDNSFVNSAAQQLGIG